jgi:hypothetical protein
MAKDIYHYCVKKALEKEGWRITNDPLDLSVGGIPLYADLGAEEDILGAENKEGQKIAVEVKSFNSPSPVTEFHKAMGQYDNYRFALEELGQDRQVVLAISVKIWNAFFTRPFIQKVISAKSVELILFNPETEIIEQWIK